MTDSLANDAALSTLTPVARAAEAIRSLVACPVSIDEPDAGFVDEWWGRDEAAVRRAIKGGGELRMQQRRWLCFLMADRTALGFDRQQSDRKGMWSALEWLARGYHLLAKDGHRRRGQ